MWVKLCATTNLDDALLATGAGADAVGFVFAESKRKVSAEQVAAITAQLPTAIEKIGVFTTQDADEIACVAEAAGLTGVQLHSAFSAGLVQTLRATTKLRILQVVDVDVAGNEQEERALEGVLRSVIASGVVDAVLLDASVKGVSGGTGVAFDWARVARILQRVMPSESACRLIVAGGLRPENVSAAIAALQPWGVDVASGVEASPGTKDAAKVRAFVAAARTS